MNKDDAINIMNDSNLADQSGVLWIFFVINFFVLYKYEWEYWFNLLSKKPRCDDGHKQEINTEAYLKKKKIKKENMGKIDIAICLKKKNKD